MDITAFKGLNNVTDPLRTGTGWLSTANNVDITDTGSLVKRSGYSLAQAGNFSAAYTTRDFQRMYVVKNGVLQTFEGAEIATLSSTDTMYWTEVNDQVFYNNGTDDGVIAPDHSRLDWRRGDSVNRYVGADGQLLDALLNPMPLGTEVVQHWRGRIYASQYMPEADQTVVWYSLPLGFHLFSLDSDYFVVPGHVLMLAPANEALIVATEKLIWAYTGEKLDRLADYGVVPGQHWAEDVKNDGEERVLFWSTRGVCAALPFQNLTERQVSVAPGLQAGGVLVQKGGQKRYLSVLHAGGLAFNSFV